MMSKIRFRGDIKSCAFIHVAIGFSLTSKYLLYTSPAFYFKSNWLKEIRDKR